MFSGSYLLGSKFHLLINIYVMKFRSAPESSSVLIGIQLLFFQTSTLKVNRVWWGVSSINRIIFIVFFLLFFCSGSVSLYSRAQCFFILYLIYRSFFLRSFIRIGSIYFFFLFIRFLFSAVFIKGILL